MSESLQITENSIQSKAADRAFLELPDDSRMSGVRQAFAPAAVKPRKVNGSNTYLSVCPCCGGELKNQHVQVDLNSNRLVADDRTVQLSPREAEFLSILLGSWPRAVAPSDIIAKLYSQDEPETAAICVRVFAHRLRRKVEPLGISIEHSYPAGYRVFRK